MLEIFFHFFMKLFRKTEEETRSRSCSPDKVEITREKALSPERAPCTREKSMSLESIRSRESRTRSIELEEDYVRLKDTIWRDWKNIKDWIQTILKNFNFYFRILNCYNW